MIYNNSTFSENQQGGIKKVIQKELVKKRLKDKTSLNDLQIYKITADVEDGDRYTIRNIETKDELVNALQLRSSHICDENDIESGELELGTPIIGDIEAFGVHSTTIVSQEAGCRGDKYLKRPILNTDDLVVFIKRKIKWFTNLEKGIHRTEEQREIVIYDPLTN